MDFNEVLRIAQQAWDKTKAASDPVWNECNAHHRQVFAAKAQAVIDSGHAVDDFEAAVKRLAQEAEQKRVIVEEVAADSPGSHSDEIQLEAARRQGLIQPEPSPKVVAASASVSASAEPQVTEVPKKRSHKAKPKGEKKSAGKVSA